MAATTVSAQYGSGFAVVSGKSLWVYGDPSSLDMWLANKVPLSLTANPVSAAAGSTYGGFVVAAPSQLLSYNVTQWVGDELTGQLISDLAFVPLANNNTVVAFGVERGVFSNSVLFLRSLDGGLTWETAATLGTTEATGSGSIAFSPLGSFGVAAIGGGIYRTLNSGATWTSVYSAFTTTITKVAVHDSSYAVATGPASLVAGRVALESVNGGSTWTPFNLPTFSPTNAQVSGIAITQYPQRVMTTSGGEIWHFDGSSWTRTFAQSNISWADVAYSADWKVLLAAGSFPLSAQTGVLALSWDLGLTWQLSPAQADAAFVRVVPGVPAAPIAPSPSPSVSPSASALPTPSSSPSVLPSVSSSPSASPSKGTSPSSTPSHSPSASITPSSSPSPSLTASPSSSPSAPPSPSASPSKGSPPSPTPSVSPTPTASPSKGASHTPSRTPSASPSKGSPASASPSPAKKKDDGPSNKLALGLGLGLGLGGAVALVGGAAAFWYFRRASATRNVYQPINTDV